MPGKVTFYVISTNGRNPYLLTNKGIVTGERPTYTDLFPATYQVYVSFRGFLAFGSK
jgi:hypothetical protein